MKKIKYTGNITTASSEIIEKLLQWCTEELKIENYNHNFIENFLVNCNNNEKRCKEKLNTYFFYKKTYPEYFQTDCLGDTKFCSFCKSVFSLYIPVINKDGYRIFIDKVTDDEELFDINMIMRYFSMQTDLRYLEDKPDKGDIILFDCNHVNLLNFVAFIPYFVKSLSLILKMYPLNLQKLILINSGTIMTTVLNVFKCLIPERYKQMLHFYSDGTGNFLLHVEADVLPSDYGGKLPTLEEMRSNLIERLGSKREWFKVTSAKISTTTFLFPNEQRMIYGPGGSFRHVLLD